MTFTKKDLGFSLLTGLITGLSAWKLFEHLGIHPLNIPAVAYVIIVPVLWIIGVNLGYFLGRWFAFFNQFGKFAAIGFTNTAVDFAILNILTTATGVKQGTTIILLDAISFSIATIGSYVFNKFWAFEDNARSEEAKKFTLFLLVSIIGIAINSGIVYFISTFIPPMFGLSADLWLNLAKVGASAVSLVWNFVGYKLFVFKKQ